MSKYSDLAGYDLRPTIKPFIDDWLTKRNKEIFPYHGIHIFYGWQGSGKTASMVSTLINVSYDYPRAIISSNLKLNFREPLSPAMDEHQRQEVQKSRNADQLEKQFVSDNLRNILKHIDPSEEYIFFQDAVELSAIMSLVENGTDGHIIAPDEIHLYLNSVKSKDTSIETFAAISQLRKHRTVVYGTSQLVMRLEKAVREQMTTIIRCRTFLGVITTQDIFDAHTLKIDSKGKLDGKHKGGGGFFQSTELRKAYDTYQVVQPSSQLYEKTTE